MKKRILLVSALSLSLFACASNKAATNNPTPPVATEEPVSTQVYSDSSANSTDNSSMNNGSDQATNSVYYGVNRFDVDDQYSGVIGYNANFLATHNDGRIKVEGNTDDTGSVEYNLALGQRRADAVKKALVAKGANADQVEAVSNGKLMAKFSNDSDENRAKNRRSDMFYTTIAPAGYHLTAQELPAIN